MLGPAACTALAFAFGAARSPGGARTALQMRETVVVPAALRRTDKIELVGLLQPEACAKGLRKYIGFYSRSNLVSPWGDKAAAPYALPCMYEKVGNPNMMVWFDGSMWVVGDKTSNPLDDDIIFGTPVGAVFDEVAAAGPRAPSKQYLLGPTDLSILDVPRAAASPPADEAPGDCAVDLQEPSDTPQRVGRTTASREAELNERVERARRLAANQSTLATQLDAQIDAQIEAQIEARAQQILLPALDDWAANRISTDVLEALKAAAPKQAAAELLQEGAPSGADREPSRDALDALDALDEAVQAYEAAVREREAKEAAVTPPPSAWEAFDKAVEHEAAAEAALREALAEVESPEASGAREQTTEQEEPGRFSATPTARPQARGTTGLSDGGGPTGGKPSWSGSWSEGEGLTNW